MISPLAYVDPKAEIGNNVTIHPFAYIDKNVVIGDNCEIFPYASVLAGNNNGEKQPRIPRRYSRRRASRFPIQRRSYALIYRRQQYDTRICNHQSGYHSRRETVIGNRDCLLKGTRIGHDCRVDDDCILGIDCDLAGDCHIHSKAILAGRVIIKENCRVGSWSLIKSGCRTGKDIPPYILAAHNPITYKGIDAFVMRRNGFSEQTIENIALAYRQIYSSGTSLENARTAYQRRMYAISRNRLYPAFYRGIENGYYRHLRRRRFVIFSLNILLPPCRFVDRAVAFIGE